MTITLANLLGIIVVSLLLGGTFAHYGPTFLAWTDARRGVSDDEIDDYRERAL